MMCDVLNIRCIIVNELVGSAFLTVLLLGLLYFIIASKLKFGFETTFVIAIPLGLAFSLFAGNMFSALFGFFTLLIGLLVAWIIMKFMENR